MPAALSFPGVYVEEIPSGVRTIAGVATSITAFIGRTQRGETDKAVLVNNYADFERQFGGLCSFSPLSFAVRDYFLNGGSQALIVRLFQAAVAVVPPVNTEARLTFTSPQMTFKAANPGRWGENLRGAIDGNVTQSAADALGVAKSELFNLNVRDSASGATETFRNLTLVDSARRVDKVLASDSKLVRWAGPPTLPGAAAQPNISATTVVDDDVTAAEKSGVGLSAAKDAMKASDGALLTRTGNFTPAGSQAAKTGLYALEQADLFNILCIPPYVATSDSPDAMNGDVDTALVGEAAAYCEKRRAFLLVDPRPSWTTKDTAKTGFTNTTDQVGTRSKNAAMFFPRLRMENPFRDDRAEDFVPSGAVAGVMARTDAERGVWKAPAGLDAALRGVPELAVPLTDAENGELNPVGLNCLRALPAAGRVVWGARTLQGDDRLANTDWKYISVRRTALFIEESLYRGTQWVVFEPNAEPLWAQVRLNVGAFMHSLFLQGAFKGTTPKEAYLVQCGPETTTADDINRGIVNIVVGFSPLRPAEFVVIKIQQLTQQIPT